MQRNGVGEEIGMEGSRLVLGKRLMAEGRGKEVRMEWSWLLLGRLGIQWC